MAITILSSPSNPIEPIFVEGGWNNSFVLDSNESSFCSMKYVGDLYINNTLITRIKNSPNLIDGRCVITPWRILEDFVSSDKYFGIGLTSSVFQNCTNSKLDYQLTFGEESDGTLGCTGSSFDITFGASASRFAFNGTLQYGEVWDYTEWFVTMDSSGKFLTNAPREQDINISENSFLYYISDAVHAGSGTSSGQTLEVTVDNGGIIDTYYVLNYRLSKVYDILSIGVGPVDLNSYVGFGYVRTGDGSLVINDMITCDTTSYEVRISEYL